MFEASWFDRYDLIVALDQGHRRDLRRLAPDEQRPRQDPAPAGVRPVGAATTDVADPYYGSGAAFEEVREQIEAAVPGLLDHVRDALKAR